MSEELQEPSPKPRPRPRRLREKKPPLCEEQILQWADAFHEKQGRWPTQHDGPVAETLQENWRALDMALREGLRGLNKGSSLRKLLAAKRGAKNHLDRPALTLAIILQWADAHQARTGKLPTKNSGPVAEDPHETWNGLHLALLRGTRGLRGGITLAQVLQIRRGKRNHLCLPQLTEQKILRWATRHHRRTGQWPQHNSGKVTGAPGEIWANLDAALRQGTRGLPGGSSLAQLLDKHNKKRNRKNLPRLTLEQVLEWADGYHEQNGCWPQSNSGPIKEAPGETWKIIDSALNFGTRGLPGGESLARVLARCRGYRNRKSLPRLQVKVILQWADEHFARKGRWPREKSGSVLSAPGETWSGINAALSMGLRGLPGGLTLHQLLVRERGKPEGEATARAPRSRRQRKRRQAKEEA